MAPVVHGEAKDLLFLGACKQDYTKAYMDDAENDSTTHSNTEQQKAHIRIHEIKVNNILRKYCIILNLPPIFKAKTKT